jgi:hypothetical protein
MTIAIGVLVIIYTFQGDKTWPKTTANVRDYVGYVDHFFSYFTFCPTKWHLAMLCIRGKRQDEYRQFSIDPEEKYTIWAG